MAPTVAAAHKVDRQERDSTVLPETRAELQDSASRASLFGNQYHPVVPEFRQHIACWMKSKTLPLLTRVA